MLRQRFHLSLSRATDDCDRHAIVDSSAKYSQDLCVLLDTWNTGVGYLLEEMGLDKRQAFGRIVNGESLYRAA